MFYIVKVFHFLSRALSQVFLGFSNLCFFPGGGRTLALKVSLVFFLLCWVLQVVAL